MKDLLILGEEKQLQKKLSKLYAGFEKSPNKIDSFVANPTRELLKQLSPDSLANIPESRISDANRFLFTALRNKNFIKWATDYQANISQELVKPENASKSVHDLLSREQFLTDLSKALADAGDPALIRSTIASADASLVNARSVTVTDDIAVAVAAVVVIVVVISAIDVTPRVPNPANDITIKPALLRSLATKLTEKSRLG